MTKRVLLLLVAICAGAVEAALDGAFLNRMSMEYVTPHCDFRGAVAVCPTKVLFILSRWNARDSVEVAERFAIEPTWFMMAGTRELYSPSHHESPYAGTSRFEKTRELQKDLDVDYDVIVLGTTELTALPPEAQLTILRAVRDKGTGLVVVSGKGQVKLPYSKLYANPEQVTATLVAPTDKTSVCVYRMGRGRLVSVSYGLTGPGPHGGCGALAPVRPQGLDWRFNHENDMAFVGAWIRLAAGAEAEPSAPVRTRLRNVRNEEVSSSDVPGDYVRDTIGANGAVKTERLSVPSPLDSVAIEAPEFLDPNDPVKVGISWRTRQSASLPNGVARVRLEAWEHPSRRILARTDTTVPTGATACAATLAAPRFDGKSAHFVAVLFDAKGDEIACGAKTVFSRVNRLDDYQLLGWGGGGDENFCRQLVGRLGFTLALAHPTGDVSRRLALANQSLVNYVTRVNLTPGKTGGTRFNKWFFKDGRTVGEVNKALGDDQSPYRPETRVFIARSMRERCEPTIPYRPAIYSLGDEDSFSYDAGFGHSDEKYFREFLQAKYGTIERLNDNWRTNLADFASVPHFRPDEALRRGNFAAWGDHRQYMEKMYADTFAFMSSEIKKLDSAARVGVEGSPAGDLERTIEKLEYWGPYHSLLGDELMRSIAPEKIRMVWWGGYPAEGRSPWADTLVHPLVLGTITGSAWFDVTVGSNHSVFKPDWTFAKNVEAAMPYLDKFRYGVGQSLVKTPMIDEGILIWWSHVSGAANKVSAKCVAPSDGQSALVKWAYRNGRGFDFVSARTLGRLKTAKTVFLCGCTSLSDAEIAAIRDFVLAGGTLVADANPGLMNENLCPRAENPLSEIFGPLPTFETAKAPAVASVSFGPAFRAKSASTVGGPVERRVGKGRAVLLNFLLSGAAGSADSATPFDDLIASFVPSAASRVRNTSDGAATVRVRRAPDYDLIAAFVPDARIGVKLSVTPQRPGFVYEMKKGPLGRLEEIPLDFTKEPLKCLTVFATEQKPPSFAARGTPRGGAIAFKADRLSLHRYFALTIADGAGRHFKTLVFDRAELEPRTIPVAYNDTPGRWRLTLEDVATGLKTEKTVEVE